MSFGIMFYRDQTSADRFAEFAPHLDKQVGWFIGRDRFTVKFEAQKLADHINAQHPIVPCHVVPSKDPATVQTFRTMTRWA